MQYFGCVCFSLLLLASKYEFRKWILHTQRNQYTMKLHYCYVYFPIPTPFSIVFHYNCIFFSYSVLIPSSIEGMGVEGIKINISIRNPFIKYQIEKKRNISCGSEMNMLGFNVYETDHRTLIGWVFFIGTCGNQSHNWAQCWVQKIEISRRRLGLESSKAKLIAKKRI